MDNETREPKPRRRLRSQRPTENTTEAGDQEALHADDSTLADGVDNPSFEHEEQSIPKPRRRKRHEQTTEEMGDTQQPAEGDEDIPMRRRRPRRKRDTHEEIQDTNIDDPSEQTREHEEPPAADGERRRRRRRRHREDNNELQEQMGEEPLEANLAGPGVMASPNHPQPQPVTINPSEIADQGRILSVTVHRTDRLNMDLRIQHPLVRIHIVDLETGHEIKKQTRDRKVTSFYEDCEKVDYILPMITQAWDFRKRKGSLPMWEEQIYFNENFHYLSENPRVIIFFELVDIMRPTSAIPEGSEGGWYRIAWAFLKPLGGNGSKNVDKKVRLQLYQPGMVHSKHSPTDFNHMWTWYRTNNITQLNSKKYPSTLYVTLAGIRPVPTEKLHCGTRSYYPSLQEMGSLSNDQLGAMNGEDGEGGFMRNNPVHWSRLQGQMCKIPNKLSHGLPTGTHGCITVKFSHDGFWLACACEDKNDYPILIYEYPKCSGDPKWKLMGHVNLVYSLSWTRKSKRLASASSDGTVRIWTLGSGDTVLGQKVLAHPCFVYCAQFHPRVSSVLATSGFDKVIRVWCVEGEREDLVQEIDGHMGNVNSIDFDPDGRFLYSGDSQGCVCVWNVFITEQKGRSGFLKNWTRSQEIKDKEIEGAVINHIQVHPQGRRLLIHTRDSTLRMLDLRVGIVMIRYRGARNNKDDIRSCISPCGSFIISGSEDRCVYLWNAETGDQVAAYTELKFSNPVCTVDYHPMDHTLAFSAAVEPNAPVVIYKYDADIARLDTGMYTMPMGSPRSRPTSPTMNMKSLHDVEDHLAMTSRSVKEQGDKLALIRQERVQNETDRFFRAVQKLNSVVSGTMMRSGMSARMDEPLLPGQMPDMRGGFSNRSMTGTDSWRTNFVPVGKAGSMPTGRPPQLSMTTTNTGRASFAFHSTQEKTPEEKRGPEDVVVAVFDYIAQRSDELNFFRGDVITVLYRDSDNWWMGQLPDGSQGFFPTSYVTGDDEIIDRKPLTPKPESNEKKPLDELEEQRRNYSQLLEKMGDLKTISSSREDVSEQPRQRRKKRPTSANQGNEHRSPQDKEPSTRRHRRRPPSSENVAESAA